MPATTTVVERHKASIRKRLRKRDAKTIHELADELGVARQALALPLKQLVANDEAVVHPQPGGRPRTYTKP